MTSLSIAYNSASFTRSASKLSNCPEDNGIEIAFAGRSNAGKSSAINTITNNKKLARTSKTPGRTQLINFFDLSTPGVRLVDLPGYGYAKVSLALKAEWGKHLDDYLRNRDSLSALVLIMDIRKPLTDFDKMMLDWSDQCELPTVILLTKSDKMKYGPAKNTYFQVKKALEDHASLVDVILFSSLKKSGIEDVRNTLTDLVKAKMES
ncbi:MAG: GTP-binding protein [Oleiphilaceae bacterium]|jgi:GTP-binding protein